MNFRVLFVWFSVWPITIARTIRSMAYLRRDGNAGRNPVWIEFRQCFERFISRRMFSINKTCHRNPKSPMRLLYRTVVYSQCVWYSQSLESNFFHGQHKIYRVLCVEKALNHEQSVHFFFLEQAYLVSNWARNSCDSDIGVHAQVDFYMPLSHLLSAITRHILASGESAYRPHGQIWISSLESSFWLMTLISSK